jgi:hypothetical protein
MWYLSIFAATVLRNYSSCYSATYFGPENFCWLQSVCRKLLRLSHHFQSYPLFFCYDASTIPQETLYCRFLPLVRYGVCAVAVSTINESPTSSQLLQCKNNTSRIADVSLRDLPLRDLPLTDIIFCTTSCTTFCSTPTAAEAVDWSGFKRSGPPLSG